MADVPYVPFKKRPAEIARAISGRRGGFGSPLSERQMAEEMPHWLNCEPDEKLAASRRFLEEDDLLPFKGSLSD